MSEIVSQKTNILFSILECLQLANIVTDQNQQTFFTSRAGWFSVLAD